MLDWLIKELIKGHPSDKSLTLASSTFFRNKHGLEDNIRMQLNA